MSNRGLIGFLIVFSLIRPCRCIYPVIMSEISSPFLLDAVSDRFEVVLRRYQLFGKEMAPRFSRWLQGAPSQKRVFASLESVCTELFPDQLSIVSVDFPQRWMLPVACVALKHHILALGPSSSVELSECGRALRVTGAECKKRGGSDASHSSDIAMLRGLMSEAMCAASRTAALEVRVAELECRARGLLAPRRRKEDDDCCKRRRVSDEEPIERTLMYLSECRTEALDALVALRKSRYHSKRQAERLDAANAEIDRLKEELASIERRQEAPAVLLATSFVLPKRALSLAGYWNLTPNDLLCITPTLIQTVERMGGTVVRREGMQACFAPNDRALLVEAAIEVMEANMPHYSRRVEF